MSGKAQKYTLRDVTILAYTFPHPGDEAAAFRKIVAAVEKTWRMTGRLKTVIVASNPFREVATFAASNPNVEIQVEPSLIPGDIRTMSLDCIKNLHTRFSTPYVLVVQDDGYPIRPGLEEFLGKADFYGAPIICDGWKRRLAYAVGLGSFNGGFSLRSRRLCEYASRMWSSFFSKFMREDSRHLGEDFYYTTLLKLLPLTWFRFRFPSEKEAFRFAIDRLGGKVTPPSGVQPFGVHGKMPEVTILAYHFRPPESGEAAFEGIARAFRETWRHCGPLKSVLVVNEATPCVRRFAVRHQNLEVQVEPSLVPGNIFTMSADMNGRLHKRFSTPYVLVIQDDGYPLRPGLQDFIGKYDFIGAPYVGLSLWKGAVAHILNLHVQNGGFSLRSHTICEEAARLWISKYHSLGDCVASSEDIFYTRTLPMKERRYRRAFKFPSSRESLDFSWDASVPIPMPVRLPFGFHTRKSREALMQGRR